MTCSWIAMILSWVCGLRPSLRAFWSKCPSITQWHFGPIFKSVSIWCCPRQFRLCCHVSFNWQRIVSNRIETKEMFQKHKKVWQIFTMFQCYVPKSKSQKMLIRWSQEIIPWHKQVLLPLCQASTFGDSPGAWELKTKSCHENRCHFQFVFFCHLLSEKRNSYKYSGW